MSDYILPSEILQEILKRLPVESLVRCTCVCKQWLSLVTSSNFISLHRSFSLSQPLSSRRLLLSRFTECSRTQHFSLHNDDCSSPISLPISQNAFPSPFKARERLFFRIVGCLHGLLCLSDDIFCMTGVIIIWNPLIKRYVLLPQPRVVFDEVGPYMFALGFGFDSKTDDYKVVRVAYVQGTKQPDELPPRVEIYSLKTGFWKEIKATGVQYCICEQIWTQCFMNGHIHWIAFETKSGVIYSLILLFDVSEEKFKKMKLPESLIQLCPIFMLIAEFGGFLGVCHYKSGSGMCDVWVRKEYCSAKSWTKIFSVTVEGLHSVLWLRANGELLVSTEKEMMVSYDPTNNEQTIVVGVEEDGVREAFYAHDYTESLVLLDKNSGSASYGGADVKDSYGGAELKETKKKKENQRSRQKEDQSLILVSEADNTEQKSEEPARFAYDMMMLIHIGFQMEKFRIFASNSN